jgi:hypothetical protein
VLILALGGVLVGFVFLVVSLVTENSSWAWGCIAACVLAGGVLAVDARRRRQGRRFPASSVTAEGGGAADGAGSAAPTEVIPVVGVLDDAPTTVLTKVEEPVREPEVVPAAPVAVVEPVREPEVVPAAPVAVAEIDPVAETHPTAETPPTEVPHDTAAEPQDTAEPDEEDADAADALAVASSERDVLVVDEHPRFHVDGCTWLAGRTTMSLPAREAVDLGFSPCSRCTPSRTLASLTRS